MFFDNLVRFINLFIATVGTYLAVRNNDAGWAAVAVFNFGAFISITVKMFSNGG
jgi:hypothetical protein